jgi:hypothetical protein
MQLVQKQSWGKSYYIAIVKSFLIWSFILTVCLLVVGFPLVVVMATVGALLTVVLQYVLPISAVLVVSSSLIGSNLLAIVIVSALLAAKGIHPHEVKWLSWLHGQAAPNHNSIYASCPLTCNVLHD